MHAGDLAAEGVGELVDVLLQPMLPAPSQLWYDVIPDNQVYPTATPFM